MPSARDLLAEAILGVTADQAHAELVSGEIADTVAGTAWELAEALLDAAVLLRRLGEWDALNPPVLAPYADAPFWKSEIRRVIGHLDAVGEQA